MKKFFISILIILLVILTYCLVIKNISIANWESKNIKDITVASEKLNTQVETAVQLKDVQHPQSIDNLEQSIKKLKEAKERYESKMNYISGDVDIGIVKIKEYKVERLWIALENYAKDEKINLKLDLLDTAVPEVYDLDVTVVGSYIGITDFIYDIEKDDTLGFKILNFKLLPNTTITTTNGEKQENENTQQQPTSDAVTELKATFKIEGVGIEFN